MYLAESKMFKYLRRKFGIKKPCALGLGEWKKWEDNTKDKYPVGYFLTETVPDFLDDVWKAITDPYYNTRYYVRNRFIRKTHVLRTDCKPGQYMDTDGRIESALANAVIDFVEIELAYESRWCGTEESKSAVWKDGRCPELGLEYLKWEMGITYNKEWAGEDHELLGEPTSQAHNAREVYDIYNWAKTRDQRADPHDVSGWSDYCEKYPGLWNEEKTPEQEQEADVALKKLREIEEQYAQEDEEMLIRLIKIRKSLWT